MDTIEKWMKFYDSPNIVIKKRALTHIMKLDDLRIVPILIDAFENLPLKEFGRDLRDAMVRLRDARLIEPLIKFTRYHDPAIRYQACIILGLLGDQRSTPAIIALTHDQDHQMRSNACEALGRIGDRRATPALILCLDDPHLWVRRCAASAFTFDLDPEAIPALLRRHREHSDDDINVTMNVEWALQGLGVLSRPSRSM